MDKVYFYHPINEPQPPDQYSDCLSSFNIAAKLQPASYKEIYCSGMYYSEEELGNIVQGLRHGGTLTLVGPDFFEISRSVTTGLLKPQDVRKMVHQDERLYTCLEIVELFKAHKLEITLKRIANFKFLVQGRRT